MRLGLEGWDLRGSVRLLLILTIMLGLTYPLADIPDTPTYHPEGPGSDWLTSILVRWKLVSAILLAIMLSILVILRMINNSLNNRYLSMWINTELNQLFVNALIIGLLILVIGWLDMMSDTIVQEVLTDLSFNTSSGAPPKYIQVADYYLDSYIEVARKDAYHLLRQNVELGKLATTRHGWNLQTLPYLAESDNKNAYKRMDMVRNNVIFTHYGRIISSLYIQKIFLDSIGVYVGPFLLLLGVVLRSFFLTRRAGGLFMSIGIGIMFFYPLTYTLMTYTLRLTVAGYNLAPEVSPECPPECGVSPPLGYNTSNQSQVISMDDILPYIPPGSSITDYLSNMTFAQELEDEHNITLCDYACQGCPVSCRVLVPEFGECGCNETACAMCPNVCKIVRVRSDCLDPDSSAYCPEDECPMVCRTNYTLMIEHADEDCGDCPNSCRVRYAEVQVDPSEPSHLRLVVDPEPPEECRGLGASVYQDCLNCNAYAIVVRTNSTRCDDLCSGCPDYCRIRDTDGNDVSSDPNSASACGSCATCPDSCKVEILSPGTHSVAGSVVECPEYSEVPMICRWDPSYTTLPSVCDSYNLTLPEECTAHEIVPESMCDGCVKCEHDCTIIPPIRTDCGKVCGGIPNGYLTESTPKELLSGLNTIGAKNVFQDTKNVGILYLPAYILPLLSVILTLSFITGLSKVLGGEIEIPGLEKLI